MQLTHARRSECLTLDEMLRPFHNLGELSEFSHIGDKNQHEVKSWLDALAPVLEGPRAGRNARLAIAAQRMSVPLRTARNKFDALQREGWRGLADKRRRAEGKKMSDMDCANLPLFAEWVKGLSENYGGNVRQAWRGAVALWKSALKTGGKIPGYAEVPEPGLNGLPQGWSYPNFSRVAKLTRYERTMSAIGRSAARCHAPMVIRTRMGLRVGEAYMIDDVWHDVDCHMLGSQKQFIRPMELAVIDVFSAFKCAYGLKPRLKDEVTGKRINLRDNDMRLLTAHLFCNVGYNPDRCLVFAEHGTAKVKATIADLLSEFSGGAIRVVEGGIQDKPAIFGAWEGKQAGNPRLKSALESSHRLPHFGAKYLPGQTGGDSRNNLPEDHHGRERFFEEECRMVETVLQRVGPERAAWYLNEFQSPVLSYYAYAQWVDDYYKIIHAFSDHELEGWERSGLMISGFRSSLAPTSFFQYSELASLPQDEAIAIRAILASNPQLNVSRRMCRAEVWNSGRRGLKRLPAEVFPMIVGKDLAVERKVADGAIRFENAEVARDFRFCYPAIGTDVRGLEIRLRDGESYNTVLNPFDTSKLFILDAGFRFICTLAEQIVSNHADMDNIQRAMGQASHAEAVALLPYRMRHADKEGEVERMKAHNKAILDGMVMHPDDRAVRARADAAAQDGDMADLLSACARPDAGDDATEEPAADLASIFGQLPGSET